MRIHYELLYKNGHIDSYSAKVTEENRDGIESVAKTVEQAFRDGENAHITIGDGDSFGVQIRVADLSRMKVTIEHEEGDEG